LGLVHQWFQWDFGRVHPPITSITKWDVFRMNPPKKTRVNDPTDDSWRGRGPPFSTSPVSLAEIDEANQPVGWRARGPGPAMGGIASLPKIREITWNNMDSNRFVSKTNGEIHVSTLWRFQYNNNNININNLLFQIYIYI
jgi:hypothetical protein